jgi:hypothetical protein
MLELTTAELRQLQAIQRRGDMLAPVDKSTESSKASEKRPAVERGRGARRGRSVQHRPAHIWAVIALLTVVAYLTLAAGWTVRALGDAVFRIGQEVNEAKWRVE